MAVLSVLARIDEHRRDRLLEELRHVEGVTPFGLGEQDRLGFFIEAPTLASAESILASKIDPLEGMHAAWPVFAKEDPIVAPPATRRG